jgi:hypothetical protein
MRLNNFFFLTVTFPSVGQNIALVGDSSTYRDVSLAIEKMVDSWFVEYKKATMSKLMLDK